MVGRAGRDLVLTGSQVATQMGGGIHFHAGGDLKLVNPQSSGLVSLIDTLGFGGSSGDISLTAMNDVVVPNPINNPNSNPQGVWCRHSWQFDYQGREGLSSEPRRR